VGPPAARPTGTVEVPALCPGLVTGQRYPGTHPCVRTAGGRRRWLLPASATESNLVPTHRVGRRARLCLIAPERRINGLSQVGARGTTLG